MQLSCKFPGEYFAKKGCNADGDTWEECREECEEICYKDPVLKDCQWSAYIDRSPGAASYSEECFHACVSGCGYKFDIPPEKVNKVVPNRPITPPLPPPPQVKPSPAETRLAANSDSPASNVDLPCTSA